jgi:hypothetical protein
VNVPNFLPLHPYFLPISTKCPTVILGGRKAILGCPKAILGCRKVFHNQRAISNHLATSYSAGFFIQQSSSRGFFIGTMKQGNLRNCTKLRNSFRGNEQQGNLRNCTKLRKRLVEYRGSFVHGFACIWTFPGFEAPFLVDFRRVLHILLVPLLHVFGAPSECARFASIPELAQHFPVASSSGRRPPTRPEDCLWRRR